MQLNSPLYFFTISISILAFVFMLIGFFEWRILIRFDGKMKRGIKIWSKPLPSNNLEFLLSLNEDIYSLPSEWFPEYKPTFIRKAEDEVIINHRSPSRSSNFWACVGYVDLKSPNPRLEFRTSLFMNLTSFLYCLAFILGKAPFLALLVSVIMLLVFWTETSAISYYLDWETNKHFESESETTPDEDSTH